MAKKRNKTKRKMNRKRKTGVKRPYKMKGGDFKSSQLKKRRLF